MIAVPLVNGLLALVGGTATVVVVSAFWSMYHSWLQTREYERHTALLVRILYEVRLLRSKGFSDGSE